MARTFYPGSANDAASPEQWVVNILGRNRRSPRDKALLDALAFILDQPHTDLQLEEFWNEAAPSYGFRLGKHRHFLEQHRNCLLGKH